MVIEPLISRTTTPDEPVYDRLADGLRDRGFAVIPDALPPDLVQSLWLDLRRAGPDTFDAAGIGRHSDHQVNPFIRRDRIQWINGSTALEQQWLAWTEQLRLALNRQLLLGLFSFESHFAHYPPGAFYRKHLDSFREPGGPGMAVISQRVLSLVAYLNPGWGPHDGGALVIYDATGEHVVQQVTPLAGTLVAFLSEDVPHEVLPAARDRYSIAGWYRINGSHTERVDPPG